MLDIYVSGGRRLGHSDEAIGNEIGKSLNDLLSGGDFAEVQPQGVRIAFPSFLEVSILD
jgi:hypothetical protein